jgi:DNA-binding NtrC family response regulator
MSKGTIFLIDDEAGLRLGIRRFLEAHGYRVQEAASCRDAEAGFRAVTPDAAIVDMQLPDGSGVNLVARLKRISADVPLIMLTGYGSIETAVSAMQEGAEQFLTKPVELPAILRLLERLLARPQDERGRVGVGDRGGLGPDAIDPFLGVGPGMRRLAAEAGRLRGFDAPVLILGETGTGKSVLARWLHANGPRAAKAFVDVNCATLSRELLDSELFGHERGAFTGATASKMGLLELADRGTVFLDEIGDMDPAVQPKLLKALEEKRIRRLGDVRERHVDFRLIAATHQDLHDLVREGRFRRDLYYRINAIVLEVPPLRERPGDIPALARCLLEGGRRDRSQAPPHLSEGALEALRAHSWPGNIRELRNVLERALVACSGNVIAPDDLRFAASTPAPARASDVTEGPATLEDIERRAIERALWEERGNVDATARRLGISRSGLYLKLRKFNVHPRMLALPPADPRNGHST